MAELEKGKPITLLDVQTWARKLRGFMSKVYAGASVKFYGGRQYIYKREDYSRPKKDWLEETSTELIFEIEGTNTLPRVLYGFDPYMSDLPQGLAWCDEEANKLNLDYWEALLIWQSEHPELFEDE